MQGIKGNIKKEEVYEALTCILCTGMDNLRSE